MRNPAGRSWRLTPMRPSHMLFVVLILVSCTTSRPDADSSHSLPSSTVATRPVGTSSAAATSVELEQGVACGGEAGDLDSAQFGFVGTVIQVQPGEPESTRWVSFTVDGWYTFDWGTEFSVYMPGFDVAVGDRLAVAGKPQLAYIYDYKGQSGTATLCTPVDAATDGSLAEWEARFGPLIDAGTDIPLGEPDLAVIADIDAALQAWQSTAPPSYSYRLSTTIGTVDDCGITNARVVVLEGVVAEVTPLSGSPSECRLEDGVDPVVAAFNRAREVTGSGYFDFTSALSDGTIITFRVVDRHAVADVSIDAFSASSDPTVSGWDAVSAAAAIARKKWALVDGSRTTRIRSAVGEGSSQDLLTIEIDGAVTAVSDYGVEVDPAELIQPETPYTVDGVFDLIDEYSGHGRVVAVFDRRSGVPIELHFDPYVDDIDDERTIYVDVTWGTPS